MVPMQFSSVQGGVQAMNSVVVHHSMLEYYQRFPLLQQDVGPVHNLAHRVKCVGQSDKSVKSDQSVNSIKTVMHSTSISMNSHEFKLSA